MMFEILTRNNGPAYNFFDFIYSTKFSYFLEIMSNFSVRTRYTDANCALHSTFILRYSTIFVSYLISRPVVLSAINKVCNANSEEIKL